MEERYYEELKSKLVTLQAVSIKAIPKRINVRIGNSKIGELSRWEIEDLTTLWTEEATKKWPLNCDMNE